MMFMTPQACMERFKKGRSMLIGSYCGAWVASSLAFLGFKVLYESGAVSVAHFFRFLAVGCVFLCVNAALLYPDSAIPSPDEKLEVKQPSKHDPFKKAKKHTCFREELQKYKLCLGHMINRRKDTPCHLVKTDEKNQLIPNISKAENKSQKEKDLKREGQAGNSLHEKPIRYSDQELLTAIKSGDTMQLTRTKTVLDLSQQQNRASKIAGLMCDINGVTYAECPTFGSCDSPRHDQQDLRPNRTVKIDVDDRNLNPNEEQKSEEINQNPCEMKELLESRTTDLQVWTAISAVSYLKSGISFKNCVLSTPHVLAQVFLTVCKIRTWFFVGTFSNFISVLCDGDRSTVARYVNIFGISHVGALLMAPLFGYIIDRQCFYNDYVKPSKDTEKQHQKFMMDIEDTPKAMDFIVKCMRKRVFKLNDAVLVTAVATVVFCLLSLIPSLTVQIATFQLYVFVKVAYDTVFTSILIILFPQQHLGKLMGLAAAIGAIFSLIQYPLFIIMEVWFGGRTLEVHIFLWLLCLFSFGFPVYLWRKASKHKPHSLALVAV
ncbi:solute carrier family 43 member 3-like [Dendronephthya gigantea]|uniref:solute carrier family 43 member 3-like n=1 Tax=Dendronephthya gigantea TaxID=151771 RepID=UPI00106D7DA0|nr:solute carrier family 43 member 3-like [Dendronephthya gigantea]